MDRTQDGKQKQADYHSYLVRLWRVHRGPKGWRASLESAHTGERRGFSSPDGLFDYLRGQLGMGAGRADRVSEPPDGWEGGGDPENR